MKILFSVITLLTTFFANAQVQYGIFAGPQATGVRYVIDEEKQESSMKPGANAGFQMKIPFEHRLSFSPSIMYNLRGYKVKFNRPSYPPDSLAIDNNTSFHTVEIAFLLQHDFNLEPGHFFLRFGPSLDFVLVGHETYNTNNHGTVDRTMPLNFFDYGRYLASAIFQFGYEAKSGLFAYGYYNYGLTTMNNHDGGPRIGNRAVGFTIGKYFKNKKVVIDTKNKK